MKRTILFLCPHNAANSVGAAAAGLLISGL